MIICSSPLYEYKHNGQTWLIEVPGIGGPCVIKPSGDPYERVPPAQLSLRGCRRPFTESSVVRYPSVSRSNGRGRKQRAL